MALSFSGGGSRAAAFSLGVLEGFDETRVRTASGTESLLDHVDFVSGVSGGSIIAAYYGIKKRQALVDFKERFLLRNPEESLQTRLSLGSILRGLQGGVNDTTEFPRWLDTNLYEGARFSSMLASRPRVWINASDIYSRTPFVFGQTTFGALCSDLSNYPVSLAVAASAAVPVVFTPVVIQNFPGACPIPLPDWVARVRNNEDAPPLLKIYADALQRYHDGSIKYVKLLDGGLVDDYGLAGLTLARLASSTPYGPLAPGGGGQIAAAVGLGRGRRPRAVRRVGADRGRSCRRRIDHGGVRHRDRIRRGRQLLGFREHDGRVEEGADQLALPAFVRRPRPIPRAARMELQGHRVLLRPRRLRTVGA